MTPSPKTEEQRTRQQEKSYHLLFQQIANHCTENGIDIKTVTDRLERYRVEVDSAFVKSVWRTILESKTGKTSTTQQTKEDIKNIQPEFSKFWEEITGIKIDWPSINAQMDANRDESSYL